MTKSKFVLYHQSSGLYFKYFQHSGYGPNNVSIFKMGMVKDVSDALIGSKKQITNIYIDLKNDINVDEQNQSIFQSEFEVREVKITYEMLP